MNLTIGGFQRTWTRRRSAWSARLILTTLLVGGMLSPTFSLAQDAGEPIELLVWDQFTDPAESDAVEAIYAGFTEQNPNVTIRRESFQTDQMRDTIRTALASGTGPDIIFYDSGPGYAGVLAEAELLRPLDELAAQYGWDKRIAEAARQGASIDGVLYGLPLQTDLIGMFYNKTLLDEQGYAVPETVAELAALCQQASEAGSPSPIAFANNPGWQGFHQFSMTANATLGPAAVRSLLLENQGSWDTPEVVAAIKTFFVDLPAAGCFSEDANAIIYEDGNSLFYTGESLFHTTGSWLVGEIEINMPDAEIGFVPFPQIEGAASRPWISGVGSSYYISAASPSQEAAGQFLEYLFSPETVRRWVEEASFFVPVQIETADLDVTPLFRSVLDTLSAPEAGTDFGYNVDVLAPQPFNDALQNGLQATLAGDQTPEGLAAELQAAWEASQTR